jgi:hypothetical protein
MVKHRNISIEDHELDAFTRRVMRVVHVVRSVETNWCYQKILVVCDGNLK